MRRALASTLVLAVTACGPAASSTPSSPRTTASVAAAEHGAVTLDACAGLPRPSAAPTPKGPAVALDRLGAVVRARAETPSPGRLFALGTVGNAPVISWMDEPNSGLPPVLVNPPSVSLEVALAELPPDAGAALRRQREARAALSRALGWRDPSMGAARCVEARTLELQTAEGDLRARLASLRSPIADVVAAELALSDASSLDDPHLADLALDEALTRATRARAGTRPDELTGFLARLVRIQALRATRTLEEAKAEAATLIGVPPPTPWLRGEAELRAAELMLDETKSRPLFLAAVVAARDNRLVGFAARAGAIAALHRDDPEAALRLVDELVTAPPEGLEGDVDAYAADVYALLLPRVPRWWDRSLPTLSALAAQQVVEALGNESDRRGDVEIARALLIEAEALGPLDVAGEALKKNLGLRPTKPPSTEDVLRERVGKLSSRCALPDDAEELRLHRELSLTFDARGVKVRAFPEDAAFKACVERWAPGFLRGAPALRASFKPQPVRRPAIRSTAAGTNP